MSLKANLENAVKIIRAPNDCKIIGAFFFFMTTKLNQYATRGFDEITDLEDEQEQFKTDKTLKHKVRKLMKEREVKPVRNKSHSAHRNVKVLKK